MLKCSRGYKGILRTRTLSPKITQSTKSPALLGVYVEFVARGVGPELCEQKRLLDTRSFSMIIPTPLNIARKRAANLSQQ